MSYTNEVEDISIIDGVSVDITVRGDEDRASKVMTDLKERCGRIAQAYDEQTPPDELEIKVDYLPMFVVDWESTLGGGDE